MRMIVAVLVLSAASFSIPATAQAKIAMSRARIVSISVFEDDKKGTNPEEILGAAQKTNNTVVTVEDHCTEGGLGDAVAGELSTEGIKVYKLAVTGLARSGKPEELLAHFGIDAAGIVKKVKSL